MGHIGKGGRESGIVLMKQWTREQKMVRERGKEKKEGTNG